LFITVIFILCLYIYYYYYLKYFASPAFCNTGRFTVNVMHFVISVTKTKRLWVRFYSRYP